MCHGPKGALGLFLGLLVLLSPLPLFADQASSTNFLIETGVIDIGGSQATSSNFNLRTSIGQPGTGISSSTNFLLRGGFLNFPLAVSVATTTTPPPPPPPPSSGNIGVGGAKPPPPEIIRSCDFNNDGRCNIIDLSIMLFFYEQSGPEITRYDLNANNRVDFPDVSVLMYYWTG